MSQNQNRPALLANLIVLLFFSTFSAFCQPAELPKGFDYVDRHIRGVITDLRYFSDNNFVGKPIEGYRANRAILTSEAIHALGAVQKDLNEFGLGIKLYDAYRPQQSVDHFVRWSHEPAATETKPAYYPNVEKSELFDLGYISEHSGHSRGSTVDMTIVDLKTGTELDMGSPFDLFDPVSWPNAQMLSLDQRAHRLLLAEIMQKHGFKPYPKEWWHFTLSDEPFPKTYFNFPVE